MPFTTSLDKSIRVAARASNLSVAQVEEVLSEMRFFYKDMCFKSTLVQTTGDKDQSTSLRHLDKSSDFFTKEIDALLLQGSCQVAIHSAKDLPDPLPKGLVLVALTRGVSSADSLVFQEGQSLELLPKGALVATSSARRDARIKELREDLRFCDIRGTIEARLAKLDNKECDAVVVAEAALIRLKLTRRNRLILSGKTADFQGQLAIVAREEDAGMKALFKPIDTR